MDQDEWGGGVKRGPKAPMKKWLWWENRDLRVLYPLCTAAELADLFGRSEKAVSARAKVLGLRKPTNGCYPKGNVPMNKGVRRPGWAVGRMRETQFKKGQVSRNTMPMWSFRWVDGYMMLKTGRHHAPPNDGWEYVHRLVWEQANGPVPDWREARIWWKDGDHANNSLSNLELIKGSDHVARTTIHNLPAPLVQVIQLAGALKRKIRNREKKANGEEHIAGPQRSSVRDARVAL
ncbi:MAG: HNH endonuclease signature motif containing protein [Terriglobales bacterium]